MKSFDDRIKILLEQLNMNEIKNELYSEYVRNSNGRNKLDSISTCFYYPMKNDNDVTFSVEVKIQRKNR